MQGYASTFVSIFNCTFALNCAQRGSANSSNFATGSSTFASLQGLGGAMRLFVAALWLDNTAIQDNFATAAGGGMFFEQSCLPVRRSCLVVCFDSTWFACLSWFLPWCLHLVEQSVLHCFNACGSIVTHHHCMYGSSVCLLSICLIGHHCIQLCSLHAMVSRNMLQHAK